MPAAPDWSDGPDGRGREVLFAAHCFQDPTTRYRGGVPAGGMPDVLAPWRARGVAIVQMPCPEEEAWGGVLKPALLRLHGARLRHPLLWAAARPLLPLAVRRTRAAYRRMARRVARQMADRAAAGARVVGVLGVARSPSCGVLWTIPPAALRDLAAAPSDPADGDANVALVHRLARPGEGLFTQALRAALRDRGLDVPFLEHDVDPPSPVRQA